jgi:Ca-activated chloride channel family protein
VPDETLTAVWARAHLRDLEDRYASRPYGRDDGGLEKRIVATSLRFGVLCRFTAWVAIDERVVTEGGKPHRVTQPVELPAGWQPPGAVPMPAAAPIARTFMAAPMAGGYGATGMSAPASMPSPARPAPPKAKSGGILDRLRRSNREDSAAMDAELPFGPPPGVQPEAAPSPALEREESPIDPAVSATAVRGARRLREATGAPEYEKRELLADLGTRLQALARELGASPQAQTVRALLVELTEDRLSELGGASLVALWDRVLAVLDELASPSGGAGGSGARPAFWKRA